MSDLFSLKMRASMHRDNKNIHISGAEKIIDESGIQSFAHQLIERGLHHDKGEADFLNLKITRVNQEEVLYLDALKVETRDVKNYKEGQEEIRTYLKEIGIDAPEKIMQFLSETYAMRGAMLLDVDRLIRLEPDKERGIRATNMDQERKKGSLIGDEKNHYEEAIVLATKVVNCPGILGEICISDDPNYVTGYVSSKEIGYRRITKIKEMGSENGGRIFLFRGTDKEAAQAIDFLQNQHVIVRNIEKIKKSAEDERQDEKQDQREDEREEQKQDQREDERQNQREEKTTRFTSTLDHLKNNNLYRTTKTIDSAQNSHIRMQEKDYVLMASNDYLDIANHPEVKQAVKQAIDTYGFGSGGSRLTTGNTSLHDLLEQKIADFKGTEKAIVFNTGYVANLATIQAICGKDDVIFSDALNHASIIDGCRLSKAKIVTYAHNDMNDLRRKIQENPCKFGMVVSDAVFSMDGDILQYPEFLSICEENNLISMVDEAHSTGVIGKTGHGINEYWGETRRADILMGTLSKAVGGEGGYVAASETIIHYLRNKARGYIFSTSLSPAVMAGNMAGLVVMEREVWRTEHLQRNVKIFCEALRENGIQADSETAIIPILVGDEGEAMNLSSYLSDHGFFISAIRYPTVAKGQARLRVALMASHTEEELRRCAELIGGYFS
ncbi:MAG: 8-amino-7-oxononanoate synthase [Lachnospiraceae bacterium]|nr:8-amino-7-oxononanoate synthase [Lachnospiraceae bacterium]